MLFASFLVYAYTIMMLLSDATCLPPRHACFSLLIPRRHAGAFHFAAIYMFFILLLFRCLIAYMAIDDAIAYTIDCRLLFSIDVLRRELLLR